MSETSRSGVNPPDFFSTMAAPPASQEPQNRHSVPTSNTYGARVNHFGTPIAESPPMTAPANPLVTPYQPSSSGHRPPLATIVAAVLVVVIGLGGFFYLHDRGRHSLSMPSTVDGYPLLANAQVQQTGDQIRTQVTGNGVSDVVLGYYGNGTPAAVVVAAKYSGRDESADIDSFRSGLQGSLNTTLDLTAEPAGKLGGTFECGTPTIEGHELPLCIWTDQNTVGMVGLYTTPSAAAPSTALIYREAVEH